METTSRELIPPLAQSYVYAGLATYQAYHGRKQDALTSLKKAHTTFFEESGLPASLASQTIHEKGRTNGYS